MNKVENNFEKISTTEENNEKNNDKIKTDVLDANTSSEQTLNDNSSSNKLIMVISYGKTLLCIVAIVLTTYAAQNAPPKVAKAPTPKQFFPKGSLVSDFPFGQLMPTQTKVSMSELSFVLYYAPWCTESQYSRSAYEHVARLFYREAHFAAINCWQPGGECRLHYNKVQSWPILMAYLHNGIAIQYHKNLWTKSALTKFVNSLLNPVQRLHSPNDLLEQMTSKDAVVVAFVDMEAHKKQYKTFNQISLKWLERDPFQEIGFGIVAGESSKTFGVEDRPTIRLYLWNETLEYSGNASWTVKDVGKWLTENVQQVSLWLSPPGTKSSSLAPYLKLGPVLLLFTPRNLYQEQSDSYVMMRQVGMEYYNCANDGWIKEMAREYLSQRRKENRENSKNLRKKCKKFFNEFTQETLVDPLHSKKCDSSNSVPVSFVHVLNSSKQFDKKATSFLMNFCEAESKTEDFEECSCSGYKTGNEGTCFVPKRPKSTNHFQEENEQNLNFKTSMYNSEFDYRSPERLKVNSLRRECELMHLSEAESESVYLEEGELEDLNSISGLSCKFNNSFSLIAIDSLFYHTFSERLGIDILTIENKTAAVIMDHENESTYLLDEPATVSSLSRFIHNFYRGTLTRFLRTNSVQYKHTHFFNTNDFLSEREKSTCKIEKPVKTVHGKCNRSDNLEKGYVTIREINSEDFDETVINSNKTSVVYFYSSQCAFCSMISHSLLSISKVLEKLPNIEFLRIDGDKNDLAWQFTMPEFPSLIVFPSNHKSDSRKFSTKSKITVQNVLGFILANLNRPMRLYGIVLSCLSSKRLAAVEDCIDVLRSEISDNISHCLREWRTHSHKRRHYLRILQKLKNVYLNLYKIQHSCDFNSIENDIKPIVKLWTEFKY